MNEETQLTELARQALVLLNEGKLSIGSSWEAAHEICQAHEGVEVHDRIHALCHRIEGDFGNAGYWDRRGNQSTPSGSLEEEWAQLIKSV